MYIQSVPSIYILIQELTDSSVAAAQLLPVESATGDDVSIYQLKWVEWGGDFSPIVVQVCGACSEYCVSVLDLVWLACRAVSTPKCVTRLGLVCPDLQW